MEREILHKPRLLNPLQLPKNPVQKAIPLHINLTRHHRTNLPNHPRLCIQRVWNQNIDFEFFLVLGRLEYRGEVGVYCHGDSARQS
jgi:hypothetical protein